MLTDKQIRMLELLDKKVEHCISCNLSLSLSQCKPYWTPDSKYVIIGESPSRSELRARRPFLGSGGNILRDELTRANFKSKDFLIINSVQCIVTGRKGDYINNGKPTKEQLDCCQNYVRKYIKIVNPEKILCLGNYAKYLFTGETQGVLRQRGSFVEYDMGGGYEFPVLFTVHPAYCVYNSLEGIPILRADIEKFKDTKFEKRIDWLFKEEEFLI